MDEDSLNRGGESSPLLSSHRRLTVSEALSAVSFLGKLCYLECADVDQLVEHLICNQAVVGSTPTVGLPQFHEAPAPS